MKKISKKIAAVAMSLAIMEGAMLPVQQVHAAEIPFLFQGQTSLEAGNDVFDFAVGDYNADGMMDLYALKKYNTGTGTIELHILDGRTNYQSFLFQAGLPFETGNNFQFSVGDYNGDGKLDLLAVKKNTGHGKCEIHVLDGSSDYKRFLLQKIIPLEAADYWDFSAADTNGDKKADLYAVKNSASQEKCEVHILDGKSGYTDFIEQRVIPLETGAQFSFCTGDFNGDRKPDLYALKKNNTGTGTTEIHVINGADGYQGFLLQSGVKLETGNNFVFSAYDYDRNGFDDLVAVKRRAVSKTEVHILNVSGKSAGVASEDTNTDFQWPVSSYYVCGNKWSQYYRAKRKDHLGMDIKSSTGDTAVYAAGSGTVVNTSWNSANGNTVTIKHTISGKTVYSFYAHLKSVSVSNGATVSKGQKIGVIGNTGSSSTGTHLHFAFTTQCSAGTWGYGTSFNNSANSASYKGYMFYNPSYIIKNGKLP